MWLRAMVVMSIAACYRPSLEEPCTLSCETTEQCPSDLVCSGGTCGLADVGCAGDAASDDGEPMLCLGDASGPVASTCFVAAGTHQLTGSLDTDADPRCETSHAEACFVVGTTIDITGPLVVTGGRPLVLWSATDLAVSGSIDASSHTSSDTLGPGANPASCPDGNGPGTTTLIPKVGSGGCGGGFGTAGGMGGAGRVSNGTISNAKQSPAAPPALRGGCRGGNGGFSPGTGGNGGGAVYLVARSTIHVTGTIEASGAGGGGGDNNGSLGGGGGGGSGGLIGLDAETIELDGATLVALGGSGGSGAGRPSSTLVAGNAGSDPTASPPAVGAAGNAIVSNNKGGGAGVTTDASPGGAVVAGADGGGGGGGGGAGRIVLFGTVVIVNPSNVVPPAS